MCVGMDSKGKHSQAAFWLFLLNLFLCQWVDLGKKVFLKQPWVKFVPGFKVGSPPRKYRGSPGCPILEVFSEKIYQREPGSPLPDGKECAGEVSLGRVVDVSGVSTVGGSVCETELHLSVLWNSSQKAPELPSG